MSEFLPRRPRVLVVDAGPTAAHVDDGEELLVVGRTTPAGAPRAIHSTNPDVIVVEWTNGEDTLSLVRELSVGHAGVLVAGGRNDADALLAAIEAGAQGYLPETQPRAQLTRAVQIVDEGQPALPRNLFRPLLDRLAARGRERYLAQSRIESLTPRQRTVLEHLVDGASSDQIAARLQISAQTTRKHIQQLLGKLGVHSRVEAVSLVLRSGLGPSLMTQGSDWSPPSRS